MELRFRQCRINAVFVFVLLFWAGRSHGISRAQDFKQSISIEASVSGSSDRMLPFWIVSNRYGTVDRTGTSPTVRFRSVQYGHVKNGLRFAVGLDAIARGGDARSVFLQQAYGNIEAGAFRLQAGKKEETIGVVHPRLSIGSMSLSPNAAPITNVSISLPDYVSFPGTRGFLEFRGSLMHGWMSGNRVVRDSFVHEKHLFLRFGGQASHVQFTAGLTHINNWGGTHTDPEIGKLPSTFADYFRVFFARSADSSAVVESEVTNVLGNALGTYDARLDVRLTKMTLSAYRQFYLEDTLSMLLRSFWDGIWGLNVEFRDALFGIRGFLWESIYTKQQGSKSFERRGTDNYYNHVLYASGWTHRGRALALPLVLTTPGIGGVTNNIIVGHHFGVEGVIARRVGFIILFTYSRNYGVHDYFDLDLLRHIETDLPLERKDQYSLLVDLTEEIWTRNGLSAFVRVAYDWGELLPDRNFGLTVGLSRSVGN